MCFRSITVQVRKWIRNAHLLENAVPTSKVTPRQNSPSTDAPQQPSTPTFVSTPVTPAATNEQLWSTLHQPQPGTSLPGPGVHPALAHPPYYHPPMHRLVGQEDPLQGHHPVMMPANLLSPFMPLFDGHTPSMAAGPPPPPTVITAGQWSPSSGSSHVENHAQIPQYHLPVQATSVTRATVVAAAPAVGRPALNAVQSPDPTVHDEKGFACGNKTGSLKAAIDLLNLAMPQ